MLTPPSLSIGIEEEYQIIDPETRELRSYITEMLAEGKMVLAEQIKAELHQSIVEIGTKVCRTPAEARAELVRLRRGVMDLAARQGLKIVAAGSHPFSNWQEQPITPFDRYAGVKQDMQMLAQQLLIFGTHVHIGIEDPGRSAPLSSAAMKSAAGAMEYIDLVQATNISRTIDDLKRVGFWIAGLDAEGEKTIWQADLKGRIALVVGSEGKGIRRLVREHCDFHLRIPLSGPITSLNASVSAAIAIAECLRQRQ